MNNRKSRGAHHQKTACPPQGKKQTGSRKRWALVMKKQKKRLVNKKKNCTHSWKCAHSHFDGTGCYAEKLTIERLETGGERRERDSVSSSKSVLLRKEWRNKP
ncbi:hypothetical protein [Pseudoflavonifractor phocaeensis]|uniref:hypothetical protein n=1 Tax=Pseudoflavonifractor phocaeensis TaxID=1870988 RepID=UPI00195CA5B3|nr:hypothetical protein [Pseudoflavonifractor phocaeensis]